jgi:hypothetical protein
VLSVISSSSGDLQPIFDVMLANATRICDASYCGLFLCHGGAARLAAQCQLPQALQDHLRERDLYVAPTGSPLDRHCVVGIGAPIPLFVRVQGA